MKDRRRSARTFSRLTGTLDPRAAGFSGAGQALGLRFLPLGLTLLLVLMIPAASAEGPASGWPWLRLSGFGTLGLVHDNRDALHPQRDLAQPDTFEGHWSWRMNSLLGLQANVDLPQGVDAVAQVVIKDRAVETLESSLEWAFLRWRTTERLALRAGRLGADFYWLSEYRDVSFAYLWEHPPVEFYGPLVLRHFDGADLTYHFPLAQGTVRARLYGGEASQYVELSTGLGAEELDMRSVWGASLTYEHNDWQLKSGFLRFRFDNPETLTDPARLGALNTPAVQSPWPQAGSYWADMALDGKDIGFYALSAAFDDSRWLVSGELGYLTSDWSPLRESLSAYLSVGRRLGRVTPYLVLARVWPLEPVARMDPPALESMDNARISALYAGAQTFYDGLSMDQQTLSLGLRWLIRPNLALKFQWDHVDAAHTALWWDGGRLTRDISAELISASLSWIF